MFHFNNRVYFILIAILISVSSLFAHEKEKLFRYKIEFPPFPPIWRGEKLRPQSDNLEDINPPYTPSHLDLPQGATNIAFGKIVSSSHKDEPICGEWKYITDGNKIGDNYNYVEIEPGPQWIQIDLGCAYEIFAVLIWRYPNPWLPFAYQDVIVIVANDENCKTDRKVIFNNDHDNSLGLGKGSDLEYIENYRAKLIKVIDDENKGQNCRYVRLWSNGRVPLIKDKPFPGERFNRYTEVEVIGRELQSE